MEIFLLSLGVIAVAVCLMITILKSNRCDSQQAEVDILRKCHSTLEENFEQMEQLANSVTGEKSYTVGSGNGRANNNSKCNLYENT